MKKRLLKKCIKRHHSWVKWVMKVGTVYIAYNLTHYIIFWPAKDRGRNFIWTKNRPEPICDAYGGGPTSIL